jgi:integrase
MQTSLYKRKDGRWEGYVKYTDPDTGQLKKKSFYGKGSYGQDVKRKMNEFIEKIESSDYSDIKKFTVEGWLEKYLDLYRTKWEQTTLDGYTRYVENHINPILGQLKLNEIKPIHIETFYNQEREKGLSEKTILQEHRILSRAFRKAVGNGFMSMNPCDGVDAPSPVEFEPTIYTEDEYITLLEKLKGHRIEALILIAGMCGLRRGELLGLKWEDVDLDLGIITVNKNVVPTSIGILTKDPKTRRSAREFAIPSGIIPSLKKLKGIGPIFLKEDGTQYHPSAISRHFKQFLKENDLKHIRLHDLRHFNGTMMLKHGVTEREASERLGHSNLMQTKKYQHVLKDMDQSSADKLNSVLKDIRP